MSQENVDRFLQGIEAFNRRDIPGSLRVMDPEIIWEHRLAALEGKFVGPEAVTGWYADLWEHFEAVEIDCPDVRDLGGGRMLGLGVIRATGKESGVETELTYAVVAKYRNGRLIHYIDYGDQTKPSKPPDCGSRARPPTAVDLHGQGRQHPPLR